MVQVRMLVGTGHVKTGYGANPASCLMDNCVFPQVHGEGVRLTTHLHLVWGLRMSGAVPLLPIYVFIAWTRKNLPFCVYYNGFIKWVVIFLREIFVFANWKPYHMCVSFIKRYLAFAKSTCLMLHTVGTVLGMCDVYNKMWN